MMNERLRAAVAAAEQLPDEAQTEIAAVLEAEIAWERALADPTHDAALDRMEAEVREHIAAGEVHPMPSDEA